MNIFEYFDLIHDLQNVQESRSKVIFGVLLVPNKRVFRIPVNYVKNTLLIPEGPYYVRDGFSHRVMRMYPDVQEAFFVATFHERQNPNKLL